MFCYIIWIMFAADKLHLNTFQISFPTAFVESPFKSLPDPLLLVE